MTEGTTEQCPLFPYLSSSSENTLKVTTSQGCYSQMLDFYHAAFYVYLVFTFKKQRSYYACAFLLAYKETEIVEE